MIRPIGYIGFLLTTAMFASSMASFADDGQIPNDFFAKWFFSMKLPHVPLADSIPNSPLGVEIRYGRDLIVDTAKYIGPQGIAGNFLGNGMDCQNCHLDAGTRPFGGSFIGTHIRYPQFRERNQSVIILGERINQCIQRPHNGRPMPLDSRESKAIQAYIMWLGSNNIKSNSVTASTLPRIPEIGRPADPVRGQQVFQTHCVSCHGSNGEGLKDASGKKYQYPPLWGKDSFSIGSSMNRVRIAASFIYYNMPYGLATWDKPYLKLEDAYDVAALINDPTRSPRPIVDTSKDYFQDLSSKPVDCGYGPYADPFSEVEHRFGPWEKIKNWRRSQPK
jgi:thiosulfate dehydrogenase